MNCFIGCCKTKLDHAAPAKLLYNSALFKYAYQYAEYRADFIYILSAKYGLVLPEQIIEPYDQTLSENDIQWAKRVIEQCKINDINCNEETMFLCGKRYYKNLIPFFTNSFCPVQHLSLGQQIHFYKTEIEAYNNFFKHGE